jgi:hypothetical protein
MTKIDRLLKNQAFQKSQLIVISAGFKNFDYIKFFDENLKNKKVVFLIDTKNYFYQSFGLGFTEEFPTLVKYKISKNEFKKMNLALI